MRRGREVGEEAEETRGIKNESVNPACTNPLYGFRLLLQECQNDMRGCHYEVKWQ